MRGHLLPYLNGIAVVLLNLSGLVVLYSALQDMFLQMPLAEVVTLSAVLALRITFCILIHRALADLGVLRDIQFGAAAVIALLPAIRGFHALPSLLLPSLIQIIFDFLIVVLTAPTINADVSKRFSGLISEMNTDKSSQGMRKFLEEYCVEELQSLYLYLPRPRKVDDLEAEDIMARLSADGAIGRPYHIYADHASKAAKKALPHLFKRKLRSFEVYRINKQKMKNIIF